MTLCSPLRAATLLGMVCLLPFSMAYGQNSWPLWQSYVTHFGDRQGRLIEHSAGDRTTSEAQAYGLFFALVANDREHFDRILGWTENNLTQGGLSKSLPAWLWGAGPQGTWKILDFNSASDADLWMSYTLLQAGRLWKDRRYSDTGAALARVIERREIAKMPGFGLMLLPGDKGFQFQEEYILNPSYLPLQVVQGLASELPGRVWNKLAQTTPDFLEKSPSAGFAMDWVAYEDRTFHAVKGPGTVAGGSYDAVRVYLWAAMLADSVPVRESLLQALPGMADYLRNHDVPPERVSPQGSVLEPAGNVGFSAALLPYLSVLGDSGPAGKQKARLAAGFNNVTGLYGENPTYYEQNLALFATGWSEGRFRFDRNGQLQVAWSKP